MQTVRSKRRRYVAFDDVFSVEGTFGVDAGCAVLFAGSTAQRHHDSAIADWSDNRWGGR
jgi:hypothetical protein